MLIQRTPEIGRGSRTFVASGVGRDAQSLEERLLQALSGLRSTRHSIACSELFEAFEAAGHVGWDGEDAPAVSVHIFVNARYFLGALPANFPPPEVAPLPDGSIALDWFPKRGGVFSVKVADRDRLFFSCAAPHLVISGVEVFEGSVPEVILDTLRRLF